MNTVGKLWWTAKGVGWENLPRRLLQAWRVRSGALRRRLDPSTFSDDAFRRECGASAADQPGLWAERAAKFFAVPTREALRQVADGPTWEVRVLRVCDKALRGEYQFFSHWYGRLGWPPDFNLDPVHEIRWPVGRHWLDTPAGVLPSQDVKLVWEPSRLSLAYCFARAYARSGEARWARAFWKMLDAWIEQNPPQLTVAWRCGQETAFRLMAVLFGAIVTLDSPPASAEGLYALSRLAWQSARSIEANINAALAQKNNHGISEALGLWTVGLLFPEFRRSGVWRERGRRLITAEVKRQIYDDGSFVQHSLNYHRVMMDDLLWALRLGEINGDRLPECVYDRFRRAADWLEEMIDPDSGRACNYGANDGALVLPLSCCDYANYRPVAQAAHYLLHAERCFEPGPWDEKALWLFGSECLGSPVRSKRRPASFSAGAGGYYVLRGPNSWAMTRCHTYRDRPSQADMLHVDLWYGGENVLRDAGTYSYNCQVPWRDYFHATAAHNTVEIDGQDQMVKGPRFLWFKWIRSRLLRFETSPDGRVGCFVGEHYGYRRLPGAPVHRRTICRIDDTYLIVDDVLGGGEHKASLRWRLCEAEWQRAGKVSAWVGELDGTEWAIELHTPSGMATGIVSAQEPPGPEGWESLYYDRKASIPVLRISGRLTPPARIVSVLGPRGQVEHRAQVTSGQNDAMGALLLASTDDQALGQAVREASGGKIAYV